MFTASLPRRPSQINVVEDLDSQVEEAGELARSQVDEEIKQANKDVKELLEKIVDGAVRHGDDRKIMEEWADRWWSLWKESSKTKLARDLLFKAQNIPMYHDNHEKGLGFLPKRLREEPQYKACSLSRPPFSRLDDRKLIS